MPSLHVTAPSPTHVMAAARPSAAAATASRHRPVHDRHSKHRGVRRPAARFRAGPVWSAQCELAPVKLLTSDPVGGDADSADRQQVAELRTFWWGGFFRFGSEAAPA